MTDRKKQILVFISVIIVVVVLSLAMLLAAPASQKIGRFFVIEEGQPLVEIAENLYENGYINSPLVFTLYFKIIEPSKQAKSGIYLFDSSLSIIEISNIIKNSKYNIHPIKVLIPEGSNTIEIAEILSEKIPNFNKDNFLTLAKNKEGYLFPDTYLFSPTNTERDVLEIMQTTFIEKVEPIFISNNITTAEEREKIINIASIVEEEAHNSDDRKKIAGVIYNRLDIGMPLQVDVTFQYINGKNSYQLTDDDLKDPSLYNTYVHTGLPPTPISNPGLDSINAAINPDRHNYLYFLANRSGETFFSKTFEEHVRKKEIHVWQ
jgi:UPF0755 protein